MIWSGEKSCAEGDGSEKGKKGEDETTRIHSVELLSPMLQSETTRLLHTL